MRLLSITASVLLVSALLSGCGLAEKHVDLELQFDPSSQKAVVIGGVDVTENKDFYSMFMFFRLYDADTQRLIPGGGLVSLEDTLIYDGLTSNVVEPGNYALTVYVFDPGGRVRSINSPDRTALGGIPDDARIGGVETFRFKVDPGEAVYLGEYVIGVYKPKWEDRSDEVKALLSKMPNFKAPFIFRPPEILKQ